MDSYFTTSSKINLFPAIWAVNISLLVRKAEQEASINLTIVFFCFLAANLFFRKDKELFYRKKPTVLPLQYLSENVFKMLCLLGRGLAL